MEKWGKMKVFKIPFSEPNFSHYNELSEIELFELFFLDELIELMVEQSTMYCLSNNWLNLNVTKEEIKVFLGILIVSGYNPLGSEEIIGRQEMTCATTPFMKL